MQRCNKLIDSLQLQFNKDPGLKKKCITDSKNKIDANIANRVFDEFPLLIEQEEFLILKNEFDALLSVPTGRNVRAFEMKLIAIACDALLALMEI
jgi:hypothetical protein